MKMNIYGRLAAAVLLFVGQTLWAASEVPIKHLRLTDSANGGGQSATNFGELGFEDGSVFNSATQIQQTVDVAPWAPSISIAVSNFTGGAFPTNLTFWYGVAAQSRVGKSDVGLVTNLAVATGNYVRIQWARDRYATNYLVFRGLTGSTMSNMYSAGDATQYVDWGTNAFTSALPTNTIPTPDVKIGGVSVAVDTDVATAQATANAATTAVAVAQTTANAATSAFAAVQITANVATSAAAAAQSTANTALAAANSDTGRVEVGRGLHFFYETAADVTTNGSFASTNDWSRQSGSPSDFTMTNGTLGVTNRVGGGGDLTLRQGATLVAGTAYRAYIAITNVTGTNTWQIVWPSSGLTAVGMTIQYTATNGPGLYVSNFVSSVSGPMELLVGQPVPNSGSGFIQFARVALWPISTNAQLEFEYFDGSMWYSKDRKTWSRMSSSFTNQ